MADIDQIIAGGAGASSRANFAPLSTLLDSFYKGQDQAYQQEGRNLFRGGVPMTPDGQPDFGAMSKALFQHGDIGQGVAASNLDLARQNLRFGQAQSADIANVEGGGTPRTSVVSPPSTNRSASATVAPPLSRGGATPTQQGGPQGAPQSGATVMQVLAAQGIPNDQLGAASASVGRQLGVDPTAPIDINDPQVRNVLVPAIQQLKRAGIGQVVQQQPPPAQPPQAVAQADQPAPVTDRLTSGQPAEPSRTEKLIAYYTGIMSDPRSPKQNVEAAKTRLEALQKSAELTPDQKMFAQAKLEGFQGGLQDFLADNEAKKAAATEAQKLTNTQKEYLQAQSQGYKGSLQDYIRDQKTNEPTPQQKEFLQAKKEGYVGTLQDFIAENEAKKTAATEEAKLSATKYQGLVDAGVKAQQEIPQLQMLQEQMNDPNFYSGTGEKYNLLYKRIKSSLGLDPDAAVPQEFLRKATAANVLSSLGALKGLGQIRVAEINMAREAASSPDNSVPANKLLTEISIRTHQRNADIAEMAQAYKEQNGQLDAGFDRKVTQYGKQHPLFTDAEIKDYGLALGRAAKGEKTVSAAPPVPNAKLAPDGNWYTPDPNRAGKYLKVVQ